MEYKFTYITVQHSGTRFLESYFIHLGFYSDGKTKRDIVHRSRGLVEYNWYHVENKASTRDWSRDSMKTYPVVSTLRHPHKTIISFLSRNFDVRECLSMWDNFIKLSTQRNMVYYNIDCAKENRKSQLLNLVNKIDCVDNETEALTDSFVDDWKPIGVWNGDIKKEYEQTGQLPTVFDWSRFDRAVNWYNKTIQQCEY